MAFPNDLYIASAYSGNLYKYVNDELEASATVNLGASAKPMGVFVAQDQRTVYTANRENNTISVIRDGINEGSVIVGSKPYSICEDSYGAIYVTCYGSSAVYKIESRTGDPTTITAVINVDSGPTGICCDSNDTIWVSCRNKGTVNKIVNNHVVLQIPCADSTVNNTICQPMGICCDRMNNIWVALYGSGSIIKITNSTKVLTVDCGSSSNDRPYDVIADSNNNIYACSYNNDKVIYFPSTNVDNIKTIQLPVNSGLTALGINSDNEVYVVGSLSNQIFKLNKDHQIVMTKTTQSITPSGFGDFTGCRAYNIFNRTSSSAQPLTPAESAVKLMSAILLTFKVDAIDDSSLANVTFTLSSDVVNFAGFDHLVLNGVTCIKNANGTATVTLPKVPEITQLELTGYFDAEEEQSALFIPIDYSKLFKLIVGSMDGDAQTGFSFSAASNPYFVANVNDQVNTIIVETVLDGNICVLLPNRVATEVEKGIVVNGMQIFADWEVNPLDLADINNYLANNGYNDYKAYINPYPAYAGTSVILNRYKL